MLFVLGCVLSLVVVLVIGVAVSALFEAMILQSATDILQKENVRSARSTDDGETNL